MTQIGVHNNDKVASRTLDAMHIGGAQTQLRCSGPQHQQFLAVDLLQILGHVQRSVRTAIVDHDDFELEFANDDLKI